MNKKQVVAFIGVALVLVGVFYIYKYKTPQVSLTTSDASGGLNDCSVAVPAGYSRIYIAKRTDGVEGTGTQVDPFDGSTFQKFDTLLRSRAESGVQNLIVCIGPGTFETEGKYDHVMGGSHPLGTPRGFTVGKNWKVHGVGIDRTTLKLVEFMAVTWRNTYVTPPIDLELGINVVFSTTDEFSPGVEVSDLTIDANYPGLRSRAISQGVDEMALESINLRSIAGGHWVHDVHVKNNAGGTDFEVFPIRVGQGSREFDPKQNTGNVIERVKVTDSTGYMTAIVITGAQGEIRDSYVDGAFSCYGGWDMHEVFIHNNVAINCGVGIGADSWVNENVNIYNNQIINPKRCGVSLGGGTTYNNFTFQNNTFDLSIDQSAGICFLGSVTQAKIIGNTFITSKLASSGIRALAEMTPATTVPLPPNNNIIIQDNKFRNALSVSGFTQITQKCFFNNLNELSQPYSALPNTQGTPCISTSTANKSPYGTFDAIDIPTSKIAGWAMDEDTSSSPVTVKIYFNGTKTSGTLVHTMTTNLTRTDVNANYGVSGAHGFNFDIPANYKDGRPHSVYIYASDTGNSSIETLLWNSPKSFTIDSLPIPVPTPAPEPIVGDLDGNGQVNSLDWSIMSTVWFTANAAADLNHDGIVNSLDFSLLNNNWVRTGS